MATQTLLTPDQFLELPDQEGLRRELDEGRVIEMPAASFLHGVLQTRLATPLQLWTERTGADFYVAQNVGFLLETATVRIPDVCLVRKSSFASLERVRGALRGAPDLAIEIVSEHESAADLDRKIHQYLKAGAAAVWAVYPETRHVLGYRRSGEARQIGPGQFLEEPELLPSLRLPLDDVFTGLEVLGS